MQTGNQLSSSIRQQILDLCELNFGKGYVTEKIFSSSPALLWKIKESEGKVLSFRLVELLDKEGLLGYLEQKSVDEVFDEMGQNKLCAYLRFAVTSEDYRQRGIAGELLDEVLDFLRDKSDFCLLTVWKFDSSIGVIKLLKRNNFEFYKNLPNLWKEDSLKRNYQCVGCNKFPCECSAEVWFRKLI